MSKLRYLGYTIAIVALGVIIFEVHKNWLDVAAIWHGAQRSLFIIILGLQLLSLLINAVVSDRLLAMVGYRIGVKDNLEVALINEFGDKSVPVAGGALTSFLFYKKLGIDMKAIIFIQTVWAGLLLSIYIAFFFVSAILVGAGPFALVPKVVLVAMPVVLAGSYMLFRYVKNKGFIEKLKLAENIRLFFGNGRDALAIILLASVYFLLDIGMLYFALMAFGYTMPPILLLFGFIVSQLVSMFDFVPGGAGVSEATFIVVYSTLGVPAYVAILGTLLYRIISHWLWVPFGLYFSLRRIRSGAPSS